MSIRKSLLGTFLRWYKKHKQKKADTTLQHCLDTVRQTIQCTKYAFLVSHGESGWPSARLVEPILEEDKLVFWIGTNPKLRKVKEVAASPQVTLAFGNQGEAANLVIYGSATIVKEPEIKRKFWKGEWRLFFPNGPVSEDYVLLRIEPLKMELMSFKRNVLVEPFGLRPVKLEKHNGEWHSR